MTLRSPLASGLRVPRANPKQRESDVVSLLDVRRRRAIENIAGTPGTSSTRSASPGRRGVGAKVLPFRMAGYAIAELPADRTIQPSRQILLVDDSATSLLWQRVILKHEPHTLATASSAEEALAASESSRPDLIIMDVDMPGTGGLSVCRSLRAVEATRDIPIVLLASRSDVRHAADWIAGGLCDAVISKPVDRQQLLEIVRARLGGLRA